MPDNYRNQETRLNPSQPVNEGWEYTVDAQEVARLRQEREKKRGGEVRHTIARDSRIDGGVYEGAYGGEAIVVDKKKYPTGYTTAMQHIEAAITGADGTVDKTLVMKSVFDEVRETMRYDQFEVSKILRELGDGKDGTKIALQEYIQSGVGVCRHQALFAGQLLEGLRDKGYVSGTASVDRNKNRRVDNDGYDGHAWVRYTNSNNEIFIIDVAQGIIGSLRDIAEARDRGQKIWDYERPEDKARRMSARAATTMTIENKQVLTSKVEFDESGLIKIPESIRQTVATNDRDIHDQSDAHAREKTQSDRISEQSDKIDSMLESLTPDDKDRLFRYKLYLDDKADAQSRGDGEASRLAGQYAGQELRAMSADARSISNLYIDSIRHLEWLRESVQ